MNPCNTLKGVIGSVVTYCAVHTLPGKCTLLAQQANITLALLFLMSSLTESDWHNPNALVRNNLTKLDGLIPSTSRCRTELKIEREGKREAPWLGSRTGFR